MSWATRDTLAKYIEFKNYECDITPEDFNSCFYKTKEKVRFTFAGWDGKSYSGEARNATVYRCTIPELHDKRFIKVGKSVHEIWEDKLVEEKATGEFNPTCNWIINIERDPYKLTRFYISRTSDYKRLGIDKVSWLDWREVHTCLDDLNVATWWSYKAAEEWAEKNLKCDVNINHTF